MRDKLEKMAEAIINDEEINDTDDVNDENVEVQTEAIIGEADDTQTEDDIQTEGEELITASDEENEDIPDEPADNSERSKLGRKVKELDEKINKKIDAFSESQTRIAENIENLTKIIANLMNPQKGNDEGLDPDDEDGDDEELITKKDLLRLLEKREEKKKKLELETTRTYETNYINKINELTKNESPEMAELIKKEVMESGGEFNVKLTDDGSSDAQKNYYDAKIKMLTEGRGLNKKKENPIKGEKPRSPLGASGMGKSDKAKGKPMPELDDYTKAFIKKRKISPEKVSEWLS